MRPPRTRPGRGDHRRCTKCGCWETRGDQRRGAPTGAVASMRRGYSYERQVLGGFAAAPSATPLGGGSRRCLPSPSPRAGGGRPPALPPPASVVRGPPPAPSRHTPGVGPARASCVDRLAPHSPRWGGVMPRGRLGNGSGAARGGWCRRSRCGGEEGWGGRWLTPRAGGRAAGACGALTRGGTARTGPGFVLMAGRVREGEGGRTTGRGGRTTPPPPPPDSHDAWAGEEPTHLWIPRAPSHPPRARRWGEKPWLTWGGEGRQRQCRPREWPSRLA